MVTTGANNAVRNSALKRAAGALSSIAAPSDKVMESGTPTTTKYAVLPSAFQNIGVCSRSM
ncbi:hypothetical protein D3C81_2025440 [compost metagenome]